ncbi:MAG TPA: chorismate-binding protein [Sporichthyaceae bacterium]|nr:chorismate-binding protein [Sporichthyaceae bacterium]
MGDEPVFLAGGRVARGLREVSSDPAALDRPGFWAVQASFEGEFICARFGEVTPYRPATTRPWRGPAPQEWQSSLDRVAYVHAVSLIRDRIAAGEVYQTNLCRVLSAPLPEPAAADVMALWQALERGNPAPYSAALRLPDHGVQVACASPELFVRRSGATVESGPIKGTARFAGGLSDKDRAENVMIVDLVRNDLGRICATGSVTVPELCAEQAHPGLVHLVSTVRGRLAPGTSWSELMAATFPPGSVSGAPKAAALSLIRELEPVPRGPYCGALGWVDSRRGSACLAVGIRTFWITDDRLHFGTGAGITWGSDPEAEWLETELKARRLLSLAAGSAELTGAAR